MKMMAKLKTTGKEQKVHTLWENRVTEYLGGIFQVLNLLYCSAVFIYLLAIELAGVLTLHHE